MKAFNATNKVFGQILKKYRKSHGMTQDDLRKVLNLTRVSIANYECGKQSPPLEQVIRASIILEFSLDEIKNEIEAIEMERLKE